MTNEEYKNAIYSKKRINNLKYDDLKIGMKFIALCRKENDERYVVSYNIPECLSNYNFLDTIIIGKSKEALVFQVGDLFMILNHGNLDIEIYLMNE